MNLGPSTPLLLLPIRPASALHRERLETGLQHLTAEDPTLSAFINPATGTTVIGGMGETHLEIVLDRLKREFQVEASVGRPRVAYQVLSRELEGVDGEFVKPVVLEPVMRVDVSI